VLALNPDNRYYILTVIFDPEYDEWTISISDDEAVT
jgi:hypothetical protein